MTRPEGVAGGAAVTPAERSGGPVALAVLISATAVTLVMSLCLFPHLAALCAEFDQPVSSVVWALIVIDIVSAGVGAVAAALGATVGNRLMLVVALAAICVGGVVCALSGGLGMLIAGRAVQGLGLAALPLCFGIVATFWSGDAMRRAISLLVFAQGLGGALGYMLSGLLWRAGGDWRTMFWVLAAAAGACLLLALTLIRETARSRAPIDYLGCLGLMAWATLVLLPLSQANAWGWGSARTLGLLVPGLVCFMLWVLWELRRSAPLLDLRLLRRMGVWQAAVVFVSVCVGLYVTSTTIPYLFQTPVASGFGFGRSIFAVAVALAVPAVMMMSLSPLTAGLMRRFGSKRTLLIGSLFGLSGFGLAAAHGSVWVTALWLAGIGVGGAWGSTAAYAVATEAVSPEQGVIVNTLYQSIGAVGVAVSVALAGFVLTLRSVSVEVATSSGPVAETFPAEQTFTWTALIIAAAAVVTILCVLTIDPARFHVADREVAAQPVMPSGELQRPDAAQTL